MIVKWNIYVVLIFWVKKSKPGQNKLQVDFEQQFSSQLVAELDFD